MSTKIWLKPEQLELYTKRLESDRQSLQFKSGAPNFQTTLIVSMQLQAKIRQTQAQTYDVLV